MLKQKNKTWIEISRNALIQNVRIFRRILGKKSYLMAVVKSNAYGHGAKEVVPIFLKAGADWFGVDSIDEALQIKELAKNAPILILGFTPNNRLEEVVKNGFRLTVYNDQTVESLGKIVKRLNTPVYLHIKCETGTSRQGVTLDKLVPFAKKITENKNLILEGLSTHFANIEDTTDSSYAKRQLVQFKRMYGALQNVGIKVSIRHTACTAAAMIYKETHFNMARVGIGLYGLWSSKETKKTVQKFGKKINLLPSLTWKSCIAQIKEIPLGTPVSYGLTEETKRNSKIAVLPIGYWDGLDRGLSSIGEVLINGKRAKIMGRICMNICMVDVTHIKGIHVEDEVVIIGKSGSSVISAEEIAEKLGTINYEIVTRINPTIPRIII